MRALLVLLILLLSVQVKSANVPTSTQKLALTCKVWGFLKYYHPKVARGYIDWDQVLIRSIAFTNSAKSFEELNSFYAGGLFALGKIDRCTTCAEIEKRWFDKNFDLTWTDNQQKFARPMVDALNIIEQNRNQKENYYALDNAAGNVVLDNEKTYDSTMVFPPEEYRLLALFRYWNTIEYFFPYKYQMDQNWDSVLYEMIPKFQNAPDTVAYHLALMELTAKIDDSHGVFASKYTYQYFGPLFLPVAAKLIENELVVVRFFDDSLTAENPLKIGDVILEIDGVPVDSMIASQMKYYAASNAAVKDRNLAPKLLIGQDSLARFKIERDGKVSELQVRRYSPKLISWDYPEDSTGWKILDNNIGYANLEFLTYGQEDEMMMDLIQCPAIIFDIRNYPIFDADAVMKYLNRNRVNFFLPTTPDYGYPGKFIWGNPAKCGKGLGKNHDVFYDGRIVLLVNESTQSAAEFMTMKFQTYEKCITIGSQTAGADGNVSEIEFLHKFGAYFSGIGIFYPDSSETQRVGVKVDIEVKPTIQGIREGRDEVLEFAIDFIKNGQEQK